MFDTWRTTLAKAKALSKFVEPLITRSKDNTTHSRRVVFRYLQNKYSVKEQFASSLGSAAQWLRDNPNENLCVVGHTDVRGGNGYNDVLSWKRANEVVNKLVSEYGADRSRLKVQFRGEIVNEVGGLEDSPFRKAIDADHGLNRRVEFRCCGGNGSNMPMPAGPSNAGSRKPRP